MSDVGCPRSVRVHARMILDIRYRYEYSYWDIYTYIYSNARMFRVPTSGLGYTQDPVHRGHPTSAGHRTSDIRVIVAIDYYGRNT